MKRDIYLLIGQSNMAGRGVPEAEDKQTSPSLWMYTEAGEWKPAQEPIRHDKPGMEGVGPGLAFAKAMEKAHPGVEIGIVNRAFGGTSIAQWKKGGHLYEDAVAAVRAAAQQGALKGILWHQGEADRANANYAVELQQLIADLRADLGSPNLPVVLGELGRYLEIPGKPSPSALNQALHDVAAKVPHVAVASSEGFTHKGDNLHFNAASQRTFGQRYAAEMLRLQAKP